MSLGLPTNFFANAAITAASGAYFGFPVVPSAITGAFMGLMAHRVDSTMHAKYPVEKIVAVVATTLLFSSAMMTFMPATIALSLTFKAFAYLTAASTIFVAVDKLNTYSRLAV